jgi:uncharacterized membrane protein
MGSTLYLWLKGIHILSATVLLGTGIGTAFQLWRAHRRGSAQAVVGVTHSMVIADWIFTLPSAIVQPLTGWLMIRFAGWDATQSWLVSCYWLYGAAVLCWLSAAMLQIAIRGQARIAVEQAAPLSQRYQGLIRAWFALSGSASLALAAAYSLMLTQPQLW